MKRLIVISVVVVSLTVPFAQGKIIYVDANVPAGGDGSSWQKAYKFLQDGLTSARSAPAGEAVEIRVAQGVYKPDRSAAKPGGTRDRNAHFVLLNGMSLRGGYAGLGSPDPNARDVKSYQTVLSGDLVGNDAPVEDPCDLKDEPTRRDNTLTLVEIRKGTVRLEGCVVTGSAGVALTGIFGLGIQGMEVTIADCTFSGNSCFVGDAIFGGALTAFTGVPLKVVGCSFVGNATGFNGGAIAACTVVLDHCVFSRNWARGDGGAAWLGNAEGDRNLVTDCIFTDNTASHGFGRSPSAGGGALYLRSSTTYRLAGCVFRGNSASWGGAIYSDTDAQVVNCIFVGNRATRSGGVCYEAFGHTMFENCILCGNRAMEYGGAIAAAGGLMEVVGCTICDNLSAQGRFLAVAPYSKGPIPYGMHVAVADSIVSNGGQEIRNYGPAMTVSHTDIFRGPLAIYDPNNGVSWGPGNLEMDPCFADPGRWDVNGTPGDTNDDFFVEGDYHLKSQAGRWDRVSGSWVKDDVTSRCIDAGDPNTPIGQEPFPNGGRVNMGAYGGTAEASKSYSGDPVCGTIVAGDINGDCRVDFKDLAILASHWLESH